MKAPSPRSLTIYAVLFIVSWLNSVQLQSALAEELVSGSYVEHKEKTIIFRLSIANPAPANLIVETTVRTTGRITATSPPARKVDNESGRIKWLFTNTRSGTLSLSATLTEPPEGAVSTVVRYRSPVDGAFHELRIASKP